MSYTWNAAPPPEPEPIGPLGWARILLKGVPIAAMILGGSVLLILLRLLERPFSGERRPITGHLPRLVCRGFLGILGLKTEIRGRPLEGVGVLVANHSSWLDIFTLNGALCLHFVSKAEVRGWPLIGWLARITGTVFIERDRAQAAQQTRVLSDHLRAGRKLLFFPEGTSTDNQRVLPFKSSLFAAFQTPELRDILQVQPVSVTYHAPEGADRAFYGWWGDMEFGPSLLKMLAAPRHGHVTLSFHEPLPVAGFSDRKTLAQAAETRVREGRETALRS